MKKVKYGNNYINIDDTPLDIKETDILENYDINNIDDLDKTIEMYPVSKDGLLDDTLTDIWDGKYE